MATGLSFTYEGTTTVLPTSTSTDQSTDIVVAYIQPGGVDIAPRAGEDGNGAARVTRRQNQSGIESLEIAYGHMYINAGSTHLKPGVDSSSSSRGQLILHELGHVVGLAHANTSGRDEIMRAVAGTDNPDAASGAGDLNGFAEVGTKQGCVGSGSGVYTIPRPAAPIETEPAPQPSQTDSSCTWTDSDGVVHRVECEPGTTPAPMPTTAPPAPIQPTIASAPVQTIPAPAPVEPTVARAPTTAPRTPSISVTPNVVRFGETAVVTVQGTPGSKIDLYSRLYPNTNFTKIRDGVVLDASGVARIATKPNYNLRFLAKAQGVDAGSNQPLMEVRKALTVNAARTGPLRYRFTGSVVPTNPGLRVGIYRNDVLLTTVPVVGRAYAADVAFPRSGTFAFTVKTLRSGYNAATTSVGRAIRIT